MGTAINDNRILYTSNDLNKCGKAITIYMKLFLCPHDWIETDNLLFGHGCHTTDSQM